jgi:hypothetical protein
MIGNIHGRGEELLAALHQVTIAATAAAPFDEVSATLEALYGADTVVQPLDEGTATVHTAEASPAATVVPSRDALATTAVQHGAHLAVLNASARVATRHVHPPVRPRSPLRRASRR